MNQRVANYKGDIMVWEERFYAEPKDILSIRLKCNKCESVTTIPLGARDYVPEECSYCHEEWFQRGSGDLATLTKLLFSLHTLRERGNDALCSIHFEFPGKLNMPEDSK